MKLCYITINTTTKVILKKEIEKTLQLSVAAFHLQRHKPRQT